MSDDGEGSSASGSGKAAPGAPDEVDGLEEGLTIVDVADLDAMSSGIGAGGNVSVDTSPNSSTAFPPTPPPPGRADPKTPSIDTGAGAGAGTKPRSFSTDAKPRGPAKAADSPKSASASAERRGPADVEGSAESAATTETSGSLEPGGGDESSTWPRTADEVKAPGATTGDAEAATMAGGPAKATAPPTGGGPAERSGRGGKSGGSKARAGASAGPSADIEPDSTEVEVPDPTTKIETDPPDPTTKIETDPPDPTTKIETDPPDPTTKIETDPPSADRAGPDFATAQRPAAVTGTMKAITVGKDEKRGRGVRMTGGLVASVVGGYLLLTGAWALDMARHEDSAMRGVHLADRSVGGLDRAGMTTVIDELTDELADQPMEVTVGDAVVLSDPVSLGVRLDDEAMIVEALKARRGGNPILRPIRWVGNFFSRHTIDPTRIVDNAAATSAAAEIVGIELERPAEPEFELRGGEIRVVPGQAGLQVDPEELIDRLPPAITDEAPYEVALAEVALEPDLETSDLEALADDVNTQTGDPITIQVLDDAAQVAPAMMRSWVRLDTSGVADGDGPDWSIDEELLLDDLKPLFPTLGSEDQQARFSVVDDEPIIIPASETVICCEEGSADSVAEAIRSDIPVPESEEGAEGETATEAEAATLRVARLDPVVTEADEGVAELESLGIIEEVSTFETEHACCQNRVTNIQRFADLMQGVVIRPDETFSLNGHVGQRTTEKGFVADGAIAQGVIEPQVGGGISQYATTFFNASFFAGLEFVEYQSHSIYISRYPRGREATISWQRPDLKVKNTTPYGILVWNEYTPTSIRVTFYSTEHLDVQALDLRRSSDRQCRIDITPRVVTFEDGTQVEDTVFGLYRPGEGLDCSGNSTRPEEEEGPRGEEG